MIKEILDNLPDSQRRQLMYAFDEGITQIVDLPDGKFVGVYVGHLKNLIVESRAGDWFYGRKL